MSNPFKYTAIMINYRLLYQMTWTWSKEEKDYRHTAPLVVCLLSSQHLEITGHFVFWPVCSDALIIPRFCVLSRFHEYTCHLLFVVLAVRTSPGHLCKVVISIDGTNRSTDYVLTGFQMTHNAITDLNVKSSSSSNPSDRFCYFTDHVTHFC